MSDDTKALKVYTAILAFEHEGVAYKEGEKYELSDEVVSKLAEGTVVEFVAPTEEAPKDNDTADTADVAPDAGAETGAVQDAPPAADAKEAKPVEEAKPWAGNHTVGKP